MHRPRSESLGAKLVKKKEQEMKKVQVGLSSEFIFSTYLSRNFSND